MMVGNIRLFVESPPDFLLTPITQKLLGQFGGEIKRVLVDPGVPTKGGTISARFKRVEALLAQARGVGGEIYAVAPDLWEPAQNIRMARRFIERFGSKLDGIVVYPHGYYQHRERYRDVLRLDNVTPGVPLMRNTFWGEPVRCAKEVERCVKAALDVYGEYGRVHLGGPGVTLLSRLCMIPATADTLKYHLRYDGKLQPMPSWDRSNLAQYLEAFLRRIRCNSSLDIYLPKAGGV